jgi:hypothetical protein
MQRNRVQRVAHTAIKQEHADGDAGHSKPLLTGPPDPHQPGCLSQGVIRPTENEIDDLAPVEIDAAHRGDFLPRNAPAHEATVQDAPMVDGEHNSCWIASSDQPVHQRGQEQ